ncbi:hypothetical protein OIDMADRAFT_184403 [Oidiodendron maius Zn]|uniref:Uncharacterized protein n=1 Tax=Oidiodendron maius (strain Zn) TaxID=913774 RepID=A0A0C3CX97_OIDMZ|nr:hypothetical protein OIDMADRAFT_184403 [Oidiodendron maius Zn]
MACTKETVKFSGLNIWSGEAEATPAVDIVAVQGLGAHPYYTWVKKMPTSNSNKTKRLRNKVQIWKNKKSRDGGVDSGSDGVVDDVAECMWLRDLLVPLFKNARIATYSYKSDWRDREVKTSLRECAEQFLNILSQHRQHANECRRPLVLIGHSLGSLVIQQALVIAVHQQDFTDLRLSIAGIIFLGGPFQGSNAAMFGKWLAQLSGRDTSLLEWLEKDSPHLQALSRDFWGSHSDWDIVCFYEKRDADYGLLKAKIVSSQSASLVGKRAMFLDTDHSGLNKFGGEHDENFALVLPEVQRIVRDRPSIVAERHRARDTGSSQQGNIHWIVPRTVNDLFTGRTKLLLRIQKALHYKKGSFPDKQKRFVITGLGGLGKSEICLKVASQMREEFWGVFWVDVSSSSTAERDFIGIGTLLGRPVESLPEALQVLAATKQRWLLILDNADTLGFDYQVYIPSGTHGAVIITSRISECKRYSLDAFEALEGLKDQDSKELLLKAADIPKDLWPSYDHHAESVVRLLGFHTLALIQAGAYVAKGHCQLDNYPLVYQRQRERLLKYRPEQAQSRYCDVYATFEASAEVLRRSESEAARDALCLLEVLSMLDSAVLPLQIFQSAWDGSRAVLRTSPDKTNEINDISKDHVLLLPSFLVADGDEWDPYRLIEASSKLSSLSLVTRHDLEGSIRLSMHTLTHAWAKDRQDPKQQDKAWVATGCVLALSRHDSHMWRAQERLFLPHIISYLDIKIKRVLLSGSEAKVIPILLTCFETLYDMRQDVRLSRLLEDMFTELRKNPEVPSKESLPLYDLQAKSLENMGENMKAVALLEQIVEIRATTLAPEHPDRLASQHDLAVVYEANGQIKEAVALLEQIVNIETTILAPEHPDRLASQHGLAVVYEANGQVKEAVALLEQVVKIRVTILAPEHPDRLASQHALAVVYKANGQVKEAVALLEQVVKIKITILAPEHPDRLASQHALAVVYKANGQVKEAVALLEQVVEIKGKVYNKDHPSREVSENALSILSQLT